MSSTAVAIKILEDIGELRTRVGQVTVGVLIAQDLAVVPMMLTVGAIGGDGFKLSQIPVMIGSVIFLVGFIMYASRDRKINLPYADVVAENKELAPLLGLAFCFGCAAIAGLIGLSAAYGAFIAGLVIGNSQARQGMLSAILPIQTILMMVFFLSIGLLIDLHYIWANIWLMVTLFLIVTVFKTVLSVGFLGLAGQPWQNAFLAGVAMAQIGEFSFLLAVVGIQSGVLDPEGQRLIISVTVLSLSLSPLWMFTARRLDLLASYGVTKAGDLMALVYGPEAEALMRAIGRAGRYGRYKILLARRAQLRKRRRRTRERAAAEAKVDRVVRVDTSTADDAAAGSEQKTRAAAVVAARDA